MRKRGFWLVMIFGAIIVSFIVLGQEAPLEPSQPAPDPVPAVPAEPQPPIILRFLSQSTIVRDNVVRVDSVFVPPHALCWNTIETKRHEGVIYPGETCLVPGTPSVLVQHAGPNE